MQLIPNHKLYSVATFKNHTLKYKIADWMKCMVTDEYGNKTHLGWNEYNVEVLDAECTLE